MQYIERRALKKCFTSILNSLDLESHPVILTSLVQDDVLTVEDLERIKRHKTHQQQNTELYFRLRRCDSKLKPFNKFCNVLDQNCYSFISKSLNSQRIMAAKIAQEETQNCVHCMLVETLYPYEIAPALYEDSGFSSAGLEEVMVQDGKSRKEAVRTILKKRTDAEENICIL